MKFSTEIDTVFAHKKADYQSNFLDIHSVIYFLSYDKDFRQNACNKPVSGEIYGEEYAFLCVGMCVF